MKKFMQIEDLRPHWKLSAKSVIIVVLYSIVFLLPSGKPWILSLLSNPHGGTDEIFLNWCDIIMRKHVIDWKNPGLINACIKEKFMGCHIYLVSSTTNMDTC